MESIYYAVKACSLVWVCMLLFIFAIGGKVSQKQDKYSAHFIMATISTVIPTIQYSVMVGKTGFGSFSWGFPFVSYSGFFIIFIGIIIHWVGILTLKEQWTTVVVVSDNHKLVESGIYKFIRHPIYAAILLELLGFGIALANLMSIIILLVPNLVSLTYRIYVEEKLLEKHFGNDYTSYEHRTKRLIPGIF